MNYSGFLIISSRASRCLLAGLALTFGMAGAALVKAAGNSDRIVVMISVDGLAGFYLDDPKADMPTLRALAVEGAQSGRMKASTPTVTWPNHTTLVTGVNPARHGVVGNNYLDRATGRHVALIWDPVFDKREIVKTPTIYDLAKSNGMKTAAIRWPASRNAGSLDWTIPDMDPGKGMLKYSTPALLSDCEKAGIAFKPTGNAKDNPTEETYTRIFNMICMTNGRIWRCSIFWKLTTPSTMMVREVLKLTRRSRRRTSAFARSGTS